MKQYAKVGEVINRALIAFREEVDQRVFPDEAHSPYVIEAAEARVAPVALRAPLSSYRGSEGAAAGRNG